MRWRVSFIVLVLFVCLLASSVLLARAAAISLTGDVEADFPAEAIYPDVGGVGDVGVPDSAPAGTVPGWDMANAGVYYDSATDTLYVGFNMGDGAIAGDADGNGNPGQSTGWLEQRGGLDIPDLGGSEAIDVLIDVDQSCEPQSEQPADYEVVAGIPANGSTADFRVAAFSQDELDFHTPGAGYTTPDYSGALFANPSADQPDLEFEINNFCAEILSLGGQTCDPGVTPIAFAFRARAGSASDDGVGEDAIACTFVEYTPTAVTVRGVEVSSARAPGWLGLMALPLLLLTGSVWLVQRRR
jgi:hypothetical protein